MQPAGPRKPGVPWGIENWKFGYIRRDTRVAYCSVRSTKIIQLRIHLVKQIHGCTSGGSVLEIFIFRLHQSTDPFQVIDFYFILFYFILFYCELHNSNFNQVYMTRLLQNHLALLPISLSL